MLSSMSEAAYYKYTKLSLQSACIDKNKGQNERTRVSTLHWMYEGNVEMSEKERKVPVTMRRH